MTSSDLNAKLGTFLQSHQLSTASEVLTEHGTDKWHASAMPDIVVFAESTEDISAVMKFASAEKIPVYTRAAGTGHTGGCVPCLLYTSPSPRDKRQSRMPSSA